MPVICLTFLVTSAADADTDTVRQKFVRKPPDPSFHPSICLPSFFVSRVNQKLRSRPLISILVICNFWIWPESPKMQFWRLSRELKMMRAVDRMSVSVYLYYNLNRLILRLDRRLFLRLNRLILRWLELRGAFSLIKWCDRYLCPTRFATPRKLDVARNGFAFDAVEPKRISLKC